MAPKRSRTRRGILALALAGVALALAPALSRADHNVLELATPSTSGGALFRGASADGTHIFFSTSQFPTEQVFERFNNTTTLVSTGAPDAAYFGSSADGSTVYFGTTSSLDATHDTDGGAQDIYQRKAGVTTLLTDRVQSGADAFFDANLADASADGSTVWFYTNESLVTEDTDVKKDVYESIDGGPATLVSARADGSNGGSTDAFFVGAGIDTTHANNGCLPATPCKHVFFSTEDSMDPVHDCDGVCGEAGFTDVYERFTDANGTPTTNLLSDRVQGGSDEGTQAFFSGASADGRFVYYTTFEPIMNSDTDGKRDIYQRVQPSTTTRHVSDRVQAGSDEEKDAFFRGVSADGGLVFYSTTEAILDTDTDSGGNSADVYERQPNPGTTFLVSDRIQDPNDEARDASFGGVSSDGSRVYFTTNEQTVSDDDNSATDLYERNRGGSTTTLLSKRVQAGADTGAGRAFVGVTGAGTRVFFRTAEPIMSVDGDTAQDIYEVSGGVTSLVTDRVKTGADQNLDVSIDRDRPISTDGTRLIFHSDEDLLAADSDGAEDVYVARVVADTDGDGVLDNTDNCVNVANSNQVDTDADNQGDACDTDDDGDGVVDGSDACPTVAASTANGCPPPPDADGDGVADSTDACPSVAAATANGCPAPTPSPAADADGDGVPDSSDTCPNVAAATANGCPNPTPTPDADGDGVPDNVDACPSVAAATLTGCPASPGATGGNDSLKGTTGGDKIDGGKGNDKIDGGKGNDTLSGGTGNDSLKGGVGNDNLSGGTGNDSLDGGAGNDKLSGGPGTDKYKGGAGNDNVNSKDGKKETVDCGAGKDKATVDKSDVTKGCETVKG